MCPILHQFVPACDHSTSTVNIQIFKGSNTIDSRLQAVSLFSSVSHAHEGETRARNEGNSVPFPSRAFSHTRVHSRAFCSTGLEKREIARSLD